MSKQMQNLSRQYFDFLVHEHYFKYDGYLNGWTAYLSDTMIIRVFEGRNTPSLVLRLKKEPEFTELHLGTVIEIFGKMTREQYEETMQQKSIEDNFLFVTSLFREFEQVLIYQPENWWLNAQKLVYEKTANIYKRTGQNPADDTFYYNLYKYIKSKELNWTPKDPINEYWKYLEQNK